MNFLSEIKYPNLKNIQVPYYLEKSRYLDLFSIQKASRKRSAESKGLIGKNSRDVIDHLLNSLNAKIPEIAKQIIDVCQKEKSMLSKTSKIHP